MNKYKKYQHLEKIGSSETEGIEIGECYIFPKIDGTNAKVWHEDGVIHCGSRNRELSLNSDNAGFMAHVTENEAVKKLAEALSDCDIYGEWLVPHSLKTYRDDAWRRFYVFDIRERESGDYLNYTQYSAACEKFGVDYISPLRIINNPTPENIQRCLDENTFLIKDGEGVGEGIVLKNYNFKNKFGRVVWQKLTTSQFKEKHNKEMGAPISSGTAQIEEAIVEEFQDGESMNKVLANIKASEGWSQRCIPRLINTIYYDLVKENAWEIVKKHNNPTIKFKTLKAFSVAKTKKHFSELF